MRSPITLSHGALSCGCVLAQAIVNSASANGCLVVGDSPKLQDPEEILAKLIVDFPRREIVKEDYYMGGLKQSAYERRNPNRPFYDRFRSRKRRS